MQAHSIKPSFSPPYHGDMKTGRPSTSELHLRSVCALREAAGLSQREFAAHLGISQPSYSAFGKQEWHYGADQLLTLANALDVRAEELLNVTPPQPTRPAGKARRVFEAVSLLPRNRQQKIREFVEALVAQHANGNA